MTYSFIKKHLLSFVLIGFLLLNLGCKKTLTQPVDEKPTTCTYPAGNRNFSWSIDTVAWFPSTLGGVWAFSDSDAYLMGNIFQRPNGISTGYIGLHWNGKKWDTNINGTVDEIKHVANDVAGDDHYMVSVGNWSIDPPKPALGEFDNRTKKWKGYQFQIQGELRSVWTDGKGFFIAAGDNGMVYTKDGYTAEWVYQKAPTEFNLTRVTGISKTEIYLRAVKSLATGEFYQQIWKYSDNVWVKLLDNQNTTGTPIQIPEVGSDIYDIAANRCSITDTLSLYIVGGGLFEFKSKGNQNEYVKREIVSFRQPMGYIAFFSPNDYWLSSIGYYLFHWNGTNRQKIEPIPSLPYGQLWGAFRPLKKGSSGKTWLVLEMDSQVYTILQGVP